VPFDDFWFGVSIELVADVDETLNRGGIDVVDRREVKNYSTENGAIVIKIGGLAAAWARIVPRTVLGEA
jgi:hypothetical protein